MPSYEWNAGGRENVILRIIALLTALAIVARGRHIRVAH